ECHLVLTTAATDALAAVARRTRVTTNTLVQGAWALLLGAHSGRDDVLFGATVSGRSVPLPEIETMVGLFINTIPVRVRLPHDAIVARWLAELQERQVESRQNEHTPLVDIQGYSAV